MFFKNKNYKKYKYKYRFDWNRRNRKYWIFSSTFLFTCQILSQIFAVSINNENYISDSAPWKFEK